MHNLQNSVTSATGVDDDDDDEEKLGKYDDNHHHLSPSVCHFSRNSLSSSFGLYTFLNRCAYII